MADINKREFVNTFIKGMDLDTNVNLVSNDSYIYGENVRVIVDNNSNTGALHAIEGLTNISNDIIQYKYYRYDLTDDKIVEEYSNFDINKFSIIGVGVIRDYICLITKDISRSNYNYIFRLRIIEDDVNLTLISEGEFNIGGDENNQLSITTKWEDYDNIKIYWADGVNSLRSINIAEVSDLDNFNKSPNFFDNTISIAISKPDFISFISGNLEAGIVQYAYQMFNKNGAESQLSPLSDMIHLTRSRAFDANYQGSPIETNTGKSCKIKFEITDDRFTRCRVYRIHYTNAANTPNVYLASDFSVSATEEDGKLYQYYSDNGSILDELSFEEFISFSNYSFIPKVIESKDNRLFAANIIEDTWSLSDETSNDWYDTRAFRFANNTIDGYHAKIESLNNDTKIIKYEHLTDLSNEEWFKFVPYNHDCINPFNTFSEDIQIGDQSVYQWFYDNTGFTYKGGIGRNVSFKIIQTRFGEDWFEESTLDRTSYIDRKETEFNGHARSVKIKNDRKGKFNSLSINYNIPDINASYENADYYIDESIDFSELGTLNYSNPYLDAKYRSYQRDELYRFGAVFYNEKGQTTPVSWIADIRMPSAKDYRHRLFDQWERIKTDKIEDKGDVYQIVTYPMGLQFTFKNLPEEVKQIEIVRCERTREDRHILLQGLISRTGTQINEQAYDGYTRPLLTVNFNDGFSSWMYTTSGDLNDNLDGSSEVSRNSYSFKRVMDRAKNNGMLIFISPEICYFQDESEELANRITGYNIIQGLSSPTYLDEITRNGSIIDVAERIRNVFVHTYNNEVFFNGDPAEGGSSLTRDIIYWMDGSINKYKNGLITLTNIGNTWNGQDRASAPEAKSKYIAKMYNAFTEYTGEPRDGYLTGLNTIFRPSVVRYAEGLNYDQYEAITQGLHTVSVDGSTYQNWVFDKSIYPSTDHKKMKHGAFAPCFVFKDASLYDSLPVITTLGNTYSQFHGRKNFNIPPQTNNTINYGLGTLKDKGDCYAINATFLVNMYQESSLYGGLDYGNRSNSVYISTQSFIDIENNTEVSINVFGGDTYIGINEIIQQHWYYLESDPEPATRDSFNKRGEKAQIVLYIPCETSINQHLTHGDNFFRYANENQDNTNSLEGRGGIYPHNIQLEPYISIDGFTQSKPLYAYNSIYSEEPIAINFLSRTEYNEDNKNYDYRVLYSEIKTNDEITDSWLRFRPANYLDVDTRFGSINNLKLFNNYLYYWQDDAFGVLSVNSRSLIQDNNIGQLVLGSGDVLTRYDHITTSNGSKKDVINNIVVTPSTMFWYDHDRAELLAFSDQLSPISKMRNVQSFFNKNKNNISDDVKTLYNKKYTEVHFMFNMKNNDYKHLIYNEQINGFTSFYTFNPDWFIDIKDRYFTIKDNLLYEMNRGSYNKYYDDVDNTILQNVVNENQTYTKVFDNVETSGNIELNEYFRYYCNTKNQLSEDITIDDVKLREDNYRFYVPRSTDIIVTDSELFPNYKDRMRGKYLVTSFIFKPLNNDLEIPYIKTSYRISNI